MCEAGELEIKQCEHLARVLADAPSRNGRCEYHEDLVGGLHTLKGGAAIIIALLSILVYMTFGTNKALSTHVRTPAHSVMLDRWEKHLDDIEKQHPEKVVQHETER